MFHKSIFKYLGLASMVMNLHATDLYTVDELLLKSLEHSPNLQISKSNYEASQRRYDAAFATYLPNVNLDMMAGMMGQNSILSSSNNMVDDSLLLGKLSAEQIIYDFGKSAGKVDSSKYDSQSFLMQNIQDISDKKRDVKEAYYNVLKAFALINVQKENLKLNEAQLYRSQRYFEAGIRTKIDVSDAKVTLIQSKIDLKRAEYDLKLAYAALDEIAGFTQINKEYKVYSPKLDLNKLYNSIKPYAYSLQESILYAYEHRAILKKQDSQIKSSLAQVEASSGEYYPSLYLYADYTKQSADKLKALIPENKWQATLNLNWNLYAGGASTAKDQEKKIEINISNAKLTEFKLKIKKETTSAYLNVYKSKDSLELSQSLVEVSAEKFDQASKRYEHGLSDYIELQQARQGYIDAKATLIVDYYTYYIAIAYLDNAVGR